MPLSRGLSNPGIEPASLTSLATAGGFFTTSVTWEGSKFSTQFSSVQSSRSVVSNSLRPHESQHARLPVHHKLPEFTQTHAHQVGDAIQPSHPLSSPSPPAPQSLPASGSFPLSQLFTSAGQSTGVSASASVLPMNTQD